MLFRPVCGSMIIYIVIYIAENLKKLYFSMNLNLKFVKWLSKCFEMKIYYIFIF